MLYQHKETLPKFITDGDRLNTTVKLLGDSKQQLTSTRARDNSDLKIELKTLQKEFDAKTSQYQRELNRTRLANEKVKLIISFPDVY